MSQKVRWRPSKAAILFSTPLLLPKATSDKLKMKTLDGGAATLTANLSKVAPAGERLYSISSSRECLSATNSFSENKETKTDSSILYKTGKPVDWNIEDWPKENDTVIAAPRNHKILLENENVRVLDVTVSPGETEPVHSHRWPSVLYILAAGDFIDRDGEGNVIFDTRQLRTPLQHPMTIWKDPEAPHAVENLSKTITLHLIRVEMKK
jgi:quercetin dioxygenase-like cupin family protein